MAFKRIWLAALAGVLSSLACLSAATAPPVPTTALTLDAASTQPPLPVQPSETAPPVGAGPTEPTSLSDVQIVLQPYADGFNRPVGIANAGDGSGRLFIVEKQGTIRVIQSGQPMGAPFLNITDRVESSAFEQGLLGLAFHPQFAQNGWFFVNYTDLQGNDVVSRFEAVPGADAADPASETRVLSVEDPAPNHNGGHLAFGPDGYLYIGLGDGGGAGDIFGNGQNPQALLGKMLRIDVNSLPYAIPPDNPFVNNPAFRPEIWATGLRNPWRYAFDRATGDLYIADVGQNIYEEVNVQSAASAGGENYGWPIMEGFHCFRAAQCDSNGLTLPVAEYDHNDGSCSVTGGYVYRGQLYPLLTGIYFYGDYCSGAIWGMARDASGAWQARPMAQFDGSLSSFGEDENGEVYLADLRGGVIFQLAAP